MIFLLEFHPQHLGFKTFSSGLHLDPLTAQSAQQSGQAALV